MVLLLKVTEFVVLVKLSFYSYVYLFGGPHSDMMVLPLPPPALLGCGCC